MNVRHTKLTLIITLMMYIVHVATSIAVEDGMASIPFTNMVISIWIKTYHDRTQNIMSWIIFLYACSIEEVSTWNDKKYACKKQMCWETIIGQQFYMLTLLDFLTQVALTFFVAVPKVLIFGNGYCGSKDKSSQISISLFWKFIIFHLIF